MALQGVKILTFTNVQPGATVHGWWNNANSEVYRLNAWPNVAAGVNASAEITAINGKVHGNPSERELHFDVKNTGATAIDIDVWALAWNWSLQDMLDSVRAEFGVPALGGATVTAQGIKEVGVSGIRKHGSSVPVETGDRWHLGSDTKAMTATLLAVLAQKGMVGMDTTVPQAFPEWSQSMKSMFKDATFERLMAHRSAILNMSAEESAALSDTSKTVTERRRKFAQLVTHREHDDPEVIFDAPGFIFSYQNSNYVLAAAMMERITGKSWEDMMKTELFQPLGMTTAGFGAPGSANDVEEPWGHSDASGQRVATKGDNTPGLGPAGTVHASLQDWAKFIRLHLDGSEGSLTLSATSLTRLHTQWPPNTLYMNRYGWGWIMFDDFGAVALGHDGSNTLWYCSCQVLPGKGLAFLAVSNIGGGNFGNGGLACGKIIQKLRERQFQM
ncbi:MAG TPA: serine hydrolase [Pyrinomonadaceae bacterium]|nr:serine hydrolase [Pyrinomonadaceae bacterium]